MDFAERYRAISARDRRFDGQFIFAVRTTGIYCRPSCPARSPKQSNVEFFPTSAAAQLGGYRACRRCLPEAMPGSPEWNLRDGVTARAMRLIADGVVERHGVAGLAQRIGYSERQLNRVLVHELGAGPLALARAQRAQNARNLIVSTAMPISEVSFAAGFGSIRQFNETIAVVFGMSPTELRSKSRVGERLSESQPGTVHVTLAHREPIDTKGLFAFFAAHSIAGVEKASARSYARAVRLERGVATLSIVDTGGRLEARVRVDHLSELATVFNRIRRLLDLDSDPFAVDAVLKAHPRLSPLVASTPGIRIPGIMDASEAVVRAILEHGEPYRKARFHLQSLVDELGDPLPTPFHPTTDEDTEDSVVTKLFPAPSAIASNARRILHGSRRRTMVLERVCEALADGTLVLDLAETRESMRERLLSIEGFGEGMADYVALRVLGNPDVQLSHDATVLKGARAIGFADTSAELERNAAVFSPWRSYLSLHLMRAAS